MASFTFSPACLRLALAWSVRPAASSSSSSVATGASPPPLACPRIWRPKRSGEPARGRPGAVDPAGRDQEAGVADHAVLGPDGQPVDVPGAEDGLRGLDQAEPLR